VENWRNIMFYRMFRISLMVTIGAILVAALGGAITVGVAALRGENAMGMRGHAGGRMELHMGGRHHEGGRMIAPEIGEAEDGSGSIAPESGEAENGTVSEAPDAMQLMPAPPQWLMVAHGFLRAVAALVPLSLIVAGLAWVLHRTADAGAAPAK